MVKVIFSDIDGVLNWDGTPRVDGWQVLEPERVQRLNRIVAAWPEAKVVITSSRVRNAGEYNGVAGIGEFLRDRGFEGKVTDITARQEYYPCTRPSDIRAWLLAWRKQNLDEPLDYVVIDPIIGDLEANWPDRGELDFRKRLVRTWHAPQLPSADTEGGLLDHHVAQAIQILGGAVPGPRPRPRLQLIDGGKSETD